MPRLQCTGIVNACVDFVDVYGYFAETWHDGEAANARNKFMQLTKSERNDLLRFLKSL